MKIKAVNGFARILKSEMSKIHDDDEEAPEGVAMALNVAPTSAGCH